VKKPVTETAELVDADPASVFNEAFRRYPPRVCAYSSTQVEDPSAAARDVIFAFFPRLGDFRGGPVGLRTLLFTIAHARRVNSGRRRTRKPALTLVPALARGLQPNPPGVVTPYFRRSWPQDKRWADMVISAPNDRPPPRASQPQRDETVAGPQANPGFDGSQFTGEPTQPVVPRWAVPAQPPESPAARAPFKGGTITEPAPAAPLTGNLK